MNRIRRKWGIVAAAAILCGFLSFLYFHLVPPEWEVRITAAVEGPAAEALPGVVISRQFVSHIRDLTGVPLALSAVPIPGTNLVALSGRAVSAAHAAAGMDAVLDRLAPVMNWAGDISIIPLIRTDPAPIPQPGDLRTVLAAALAGGLAAALLLFPLPKREDPLDLMDLLRRWGRLARRRLPGLLMLCLLCGGGNLLWTALTFSPVCTASAVVSVGTYDPDSARALPATVSGLLASDLAPRPGITAEAIGQSNLFALTAPGETPAAAEAALTAAITQWPELAAYAHRDLTMQPHQPIQVTAPQSFQPLAACGTGILVGVVLWALILFLSLLLLPLNIDTAPSEAYNKSQS